MFQNRHLKDKFVLSKTLMLEKKTKIKPKAIIFCFPLYVKQDL